MKWIYRLIWNCCIFHIPPIGSNLFAPSLLVMDNKDTELFHCWPVPNKYNFHLWIPWRWLMYKPNKTNFLPGPSSLQEFLPADRSKHQWPIQQWWEQPTIRATSAFQQNTCTQTLARGRVSKCLQGVKKCRHDACWMRINHIRSFAWLTSTRTL